MGKMETVEVVIRISRKDMETINDPKGKGKMEDNMESYRKMIQIADRVFLAVENGTVLPKGHDDLIERAQVTNYDNLYDVPTVIEADREVDHD